MGSKVRVVMTGHGRGDVFVDGVKVPFVRSVEVLIERGDVNRLILTLFPEQVEIEGNAGG